MKQEQKIVAIGAANGVIGMIVMVWLLSGLIPAPAIADTAADRIAYALPWATPPALLFFFMVAAVGNARFKSEAIDPTASKESQRMIVDGRVADNTHQQLMLFLIGLLGLAVTAADRAAERDRRGRHHLRRRAVHLLVRLPEASALSRAGLLLDRLPQSRDAAGDSVAVVALGPSR